MAQASTWKIIGRELLFYCVVCPVFIAYVAIQAAIGIILLIPTIIATIAKSWKWKARLKNPWYDIATMAARMWLHVRCTYYQEYLPWKEARAAAKAKREPKPNVWVRPPILWVSSSFSWACSTDRYDEDGVFILVWLMINSLFSLGMIMNFIYSWILVLSVWGIRHYYTEVPVAPTTPPKPPAAEVYQQRVADKQETDFGPWLNGGEVMEEKHLATFLNLALISDTGTIKYSQRYGSGVEGFAPYASEHIANARVDGTQVVFKDERHNKLRVNVGQVFLFENDNVRAYQFSASGELLSTRNFKPQVMK